MSSKEVFGRVKRGMYRDRSVHSYCLCNLAMTKCPPRIMKIQFSPLPLPGEDRGQDGFRSNGFPLTFLLSPRGERKFQRFDFLSN